MLINGLELSIKDMGELRYLVDWKIDDLEEGIRCEDYSDDPELLEQMNEDVAQYVRIQEFLSKLYRGGIGLS